MARPKGSTNKAREEATTSRETVSRPKRRPMGDGYRNMLTFDNRDPNFVYRIFNDVDGRLARAEEAGYEAVVSSQELGEKTADTATSVGSAVTRPVGGGVNGVLMKIPREWYEDDQLKKQERVDASEAGLNQKKAGQYGGVHIQHGNRRPVG